RARLEAAFSELSKRGKTLLTQLWDGLAALDGVRLFGPPPDAPRTPTVAFTVRGKSAREVSRLLAERGVFASSGDFYASTVLERLGQEGLVRAGCACYTAAEEVERLISGVREISQS
ncbi:MAG: aminotransferase class V-fold PLP-dependent enzyme, partial [bacterium]